MGTENRLYFRKGKVIDMKNNWYETEGWYEPLRRPQTPVSKPGKAAKKKKGLTGRRVLALTLIVAVLVVASSVAFRNKGTQVESYFSFGDELPEDFSDFFDSYYTGVTTEITSVDLPKYEGRTDYSLKLRVQGTKELELNELYKKCVDSIVCIKAYEKDDSVGYSWGSGIIMSENGFILTNTHIIEGKSRAVVVTSDDLEYQAELVGADSISDLAVLKINARGLTSAEFGNSNELEIGDRVAAIGNPLSASFRSTLTDGIVSGIERGMQYNGHVMNLIQTNTAINNGNSGGALFNMYGQVVGITNMKMVSDYTTNVEGIGFAIPSAAFAPAVNMLLDDGVITGRTSIGITVGEIPDEAAARYELPTGLYIYEVNEKSDAAAQGLMPGDIILEANGSIVKHTSDIAAIKDKLSVGDSIKFKIWRDNETFEVEVKLIDTNDLYN